MSVSNNFKSLLTDFFSLYHPRQVAKVDAIVEAFKGEEVEVLKSLCVKYKKPYSVIPGLTEALAAPATPAPALEETVDEEEIVSEDAVEVETKEAETSENSEAGEEEEEK